MSTTTTTITAVSRGIPFTFAPATNKFERAALDHLELYVYTDTRLRRADPDSEEMRLYLRLHEIEAEILRVLREIAPRKFERVSYSVEANYIYSKATEDAVNDIQRERAKKA